MEHPAFNVTPRALGTDQVKRLIEKFGEAAGRAMEAGYDAVQIHGAHGYLVDQFMSPRFNLRDDVYGDPQRFVMEVYDAVKAQAGRAPVLVKLNMDDCLEGSTSPEISLPIAKALSGAGIDAIEVSGGTQASGRLSPSRTRIKTSHDEAYFLEFARKVKAEVGCPVIGVGGYRSPEVINRVLASRDVDFIAMSRPFIREPGLVRRWSGGDLEKARCISCNGCFNTVKHGEGIQCWQELRAQGKI